ncbi:MAG: SAM-dependent DNA methyltransferase [Magnetococcales bacterium]|nr:SAM-dependent DNA methyltransferase [Magnetococcales bacterium]
MDNELGDHPPTGKGGQGVSSLNISNFIWGIADDVLRDVYVRGKYRDVILPMTVIRRLDAVLEPTKDAVLRMKAQLDKAGVANQDAALRQSSGEAFYNTSPFRLRDLTYRAKQQQLKADFEAYLDGFSPNVQEVLEKFKFRNQMPTLVEADVLGYLIEKFLDQSVNLSPKPVLHQDGSVRLPGLDNHSMGTIFEELIRRFNEENNEEAGEHFTPRDVVELMAYLIFMPVAEAIQSGTYLVYDGACGTGGMLTVAEETLDKLAAEHGKEVSVHLYGQEVNPETFAISKADLILKGEGVEAENMKFGSTLSADAFPSREFDFMLSNPPYGKSWKTDLDRIGGKRDLRDPRFVIDHGGNPEYSLITRSSDGQMVFLANMLSKMKKVSSLGSRIAEVHNGSSLFTGDAGSGESNIRRWIIENDWLEAIIALPLNIFYNTGIATYIWVLSNRKAPERRGKVQLIDATAWFKPLRKNLGKKNCELGSDDLRRICDAFLNREENEQSKVFPNEAFGYWKVTVERPLRLMVDLSAGMVRKFRKTCADVGEGDLADLVENLVTPLGHGPHGDFNRFLEQVESAAKAQGMRMTAKRQKLLMTGLGVKDPGAEPVIKQVTRAKAGADQEQDALHGSYHRVVSGKPMVVEYEPDTDLRDTEQVPFLEEGGVEVFIRREVLPHAPDAWIDAGKTAIGYEISFTRHFYKPQPLRTLEEIEADIRDLEKETDGLLDDVIGRRA